MRKWYAVAAGLAACVGASAFAGISHDNVEPSKDPFGGLPGSYTGLNLGGKELADWLGSLTPDQMLALKIQYHNLWASGTDGRLSLVPQWDRPNFLKTGDQSGEWPHETDRVVVPVPGSIALAVIALGSVLGLRRKA